MFKPNNSSYYLTHNYLGEESISGCPFLAGDTSSESLNLLIYGHHMADGTQFSDLENFCDFDFFKSSSLATLILKDGSKKIYTPIAVFKTSISPTEFPYYQYANCKDPLRKEDYIRNITPLSLFGQVNTHGGNLLTLSTCSYHTENGRLVVVFEEI